MDDTNSKPQNKGMYWWASKIVWATTAVIAVLDLLLNVWHDAPESYHRILTTFIWLLVLGSVLFLVEGLRKLVERGERSEELLLENNERLAQTFNIVRHHAVVLPINPHDFDAFKLIFGTAQRIAAYNPPLTLLQLERDSRYRNVIFNFLETTDKEYKAIVGEVGAERLTELRRLWIYEKTTKRALAAMKRMHVTSYTDPSGLHTKLSPWPIFEGDDLRGLSFFLIEGYRHRKVLLYILGKPFVGDFEVPDLGLLITEPSDKSEIFDKLQTAFNQRWTALCARGKAPTVLGDLDLPRFSDEFAKGKA